MLKHLEQLATTMRLFAFQLLGLNADNSNNNDAREEAFGQVVDMVLDLRAKAKADKDGHTPRSSIGRPDPSGPLFHVKHASPQAEATRLKGGLSQWAITLAYRAPAFGVPRET